jgi:hypothetical protein
VQANGKELQRSDGGVLAMKTYKHLRDEHGVTALRGLASRLCQTRVK